MEFDLNGIKDKYGTDVENIQILKDNVALLIKNDGTKYILKIKRPYSKKSWIDNLRFYNESRIYKCFSVFNFKNLNPPKLFHIDSESFLIQYLERCTDISLSKVDTDDFVLSYLELQSLQINGNIWLNFKNQLLRGLFYQGVVVPLFSLRKKIGTTNTIKSVLLFLKLNLSEKKLNRKYWLHGDLTSNNIFYNKFDNKLYFIDFENMFYTRKWLLLEIIEHCIKFKNGLFYLDDSKLKAYLKFAFSFEKDLKRINLKHQIRFSLLLTANSNLAFTKNDKKRKDLLDFLKIILSDKKFNIWYNNNISSISNYEVMTHEYT